MSEERNNRLINNTIFQYCGYIWIIFTGIFLTPYIIGHIGIRDFGIYAILLAIFRYFELLDLGIEAAVVKHVSQFESLTDNKSISEYVTTALFIQFAMLIIAIVLSYVTLTLAASTFTNNLDWGRYYIPLAMMSILAGALKNLFNVFRGTIMGMQRMGVSNTVEIIATFPYFISIVIFFRLGYGLFGLMISRLILVTISGIAMSFSAKEVKREMEVKVRHIRKDVFKNLFHFGGRLQISRLAQLISFQLDKILIGIFLEVSMAGLYEIGAKIATLTRNLPLIMISALLPSISEIHAEGNMEKVRSLFIRGTKYLLIIGIPLLLFAEIFAQNIIYAWIGEGYPQAVMALRFLCLGYFFNLMTGMISATSVGIGKPELEMKAGIVALILNVSLSFTLIILFGFKGVLAGTTISLAITSLYYFHIFYRVVQFRLERMLRLFLMPILLSLISIIVSSISARELILLLPSAKNLLVSRVYILSGLAIYFVSYLLLLWWSGHIDNMEKEIVAKRWSKILGRFAEDI